MRGEGRGRRGRREEKEDGERGVKRQRDEKSHCCQLDNIKQLSFIKPLGRLRV